MKHFVILFFFILIGCNNSDKLAFENISLKKENDSLKEILKTKFIFDDVKIRIIPSENNTNRIGSEYVGEYVLAAYNKLDIVEFTTELKPNGAFVNPKSLTRKFGGYLFETKLSKKQNYLHCKIKTNSKIGLNYVLNSGVFSDLKKAN